MLGYVALVFLFVLSIKTAVALQRHRATFAAHGVAPLQIYSLQLFVLLYCFGLAAFVGLGYWFGSFPSATLGLTLSLPGIFLGRRVAAKLDVGNDTAIIASRAASNAFWLGVAAIIFIVGNLVVLLIFRSVGG